MDRIDVTGIDKVKFAQAAYDLSVPQGLGYLHARSGSLSDEDAMSCIADGRNGAELHMDYVHGRSIKMNLIIEADGKLTAPDSWYDHTDEQYDKLLAQFDISREGESKHGCACNCEECQPNSGSRSLEGVSKMLGGDPQIKEALKKTMDHFQGE